MKITTGFAQLSSARLCYELITPANGVWHGTIVMIMGLGAPLSTCPLSLCKLLCAAGLRVLRYDNRDTGLSSDSIYSCELNIAKAFFAQKLGREVAAPYTLERLSSDAVELLDFLNIDTAHILGASMGGMLAQLLAASAPERVLSLCTIMSSTNSPKLPLPNFKVLLFLLGLRGCKIIDADSAATNRLQYWRIIKSPRFPSDERVIAARTREQYQRSYRPNASSIHNLAIIKSGDISANNANIRAPTLVIHGDADKMVSSKGSYAIQQSIANARLHIIKGFGHELPDSASALLAQLILDNCQQSA